MRNNLKSHNIINVMRSYPKFTLIELLVVIAIIAILASMLLPTLTKSQERAKMSICQSNMKQVGTAFTLYTDSSDGYFPAYYNTNIEGKYWACILTLNKYITASAFSCPSRKEYEFQAKNPPTTSSTYWGYVPFGFNYHFLGNASYPAKASNVKKPSATILAAEGSHAKEWTDNGRADAPRGQAQIHWVYSTASGQAVPIHNAATECNILWVDGHISSQKITWTGAYTYSFPYLYKNEFSVMYSTNTDSVSTTGIDPRTQDRDNNWDLF